MRIALIIYTLFVVGRRDTVFGMATHISMFWGSNPGKDYSFFRNCPD
jgi:hypothetical protein